MWIYQKTRVQNFPEIKTLNTLFGQDQGGQHGQGSQGGQCDQDGQSGQGLTPFFEPTSN